MSAGRLTNRGALNADGSAPVLPPAAAAAPAPAPAAPAPGKRKAGGGGAGAPKPKRRAVHTNPEQRQLSSITGSERRKLDRAFDTFDSPTKRVAACRRQGATEDYDLVCPLSPMEPGEERCAGPVCDCTLSHSQLALSIPLYPEQRAQIANLKYERKEARKAAVAGRKEEAAAAAAARKEASAATRAARDKENLDSAATALRTLPRARSPRARSPLSSPTARQLPFGRERGSMEDASMEEAAALLLDAARLF